MAGLIYIDAETWRYENAGTSTLLKVAANDLTNLPVTKSKTRIAFWQKQRSGIFDIPASKELWIKFDLYYGGSKWRVYDRLNGNDTGIGNYTQSNSITSFINGPLQYEVLPANTIATSSLKTFLLHMVSDATNGLVELWVDGVKHYSEEFADEGLIYSGNVENGADFANLYLQSDGSSTVYSNIIISNKRIGLGENVIGYDLTQSITFDAERQLKTHGTFITAQFDTARRLATSINKEACLTFDNNSILLEKPYPDGADIFTIEVKFSTISTNGTIVGYFNTNFKQGNLRAGDFKLELSNGDLSFIVIYGARTWNFLNSGYSDSKITINDGKIHKVAVISYADGSTELYVDKQMVSRRDSMNSQLPKENFTVATDETNSALQMNLQEMRFWSVVRTADEIFSDIRGDEEGLVAWYLPEPDGLRDHSVNQHTTHNEGDTPITYTASFPPEKFDLEWNFIAPFPVSATFDVSREVVSYWRYYNPGSEIYLLTHGVQLDNLPVDKSKTGVAFYQTAREKCFDIPATRDFWVKFDVYCTDSSQTWRALSIDDDGTIFYGVRSYSDGALGVFLYKKTTQLIVDDAIKVGTLQTILMHMTAATVEVWVDGGSKYSYSNKKGSATAWFNESHSYSRDTDTTIYVFGGVDNFFLQSDGEGTFFSNIIISDRQISFDDGAQRFTCDTERTVGFSSDLYVDLVREVLAPARIRKAVDIQRRVIKPVTFNADIAALLINTLMFDTERLPLLYELFHCDIARQLPHGLIITPTDLPEQVDTTGVQSITIDLAAQQLTDQLSFTWIHPVEIMQQIRGQYLDYKFDMRIEEITQNGILATCHCCSDIDLLLYTQFNYEIEPNYCIVYRGDTKKRLLERMNPGWTASDIEDVEVKKATARYHLYHFGDVLGIKKQGVIRFDDFVSDMEIEQKNVTYADLISNLFGWTSRIPQMMIHCYLRDDKLYVIQRGYEENEIDITGLKYTLPEVNLKLMRTAWGSAPEDEYQVEKIHPYYKVLLPPPYRSEDGKTYYTYRHIGSGLDAGYLLVATVTYNDDGSSVATDYTYSTQQPYTLTGERSTTFDERGRTIDEHYIQHNYLTPSQTHHVWIDEDGEETNSVVGSHVAGFYAEWVTLVEATTETKTATLPNPLISTDFPVVNNDTIIKLVNAIRWLNRKTQETISMDIYDYPHVIDFNDRIIFNGNVYFLESNSVVKTPRIVNKQSIKIVRWY